MYYMYTCSDGVCVPMLYVVSGVMVSDRPGSWAVAGDHVILAIQGTEMNKLRYILCMYPYVSV